MVERPDPEKGQIVERSAAFALEIIRLYQKLEKSALGRVIGKQLLRAGTSIGANVHEAQGAQSKADFIAKISIAHKEALETSYWLRLIKNAGLIPLDEVIGIDDETSQLLKILSQILLTSKRNLSHSTVDR